MNQGKVLILHLFCKTNLRINLNTKFMFSWITGHNQRWNWQLLDSKGNEYIFKVQKESLLLGKQKTLTL